MPHLPAQSIDDLRRDLAILLETQASELLEGAASDIHTYVNAIASNMISAALLPPDRQAALLSELAAQLKAVAELNRIRAAEAGWAVFERVVNTASSVLVSVLLAAVPNRTDEPGA